jgi:phage tail protein X
MAIESFEIVSVAGEFVTADMLVWRRYRRRAPGVLEEMLDLNPHLATIHRETPFLPVGVQVRIPIDPDILAGRPKTIDYVYLWGKKP